MRGGGGGGGAPPPPPPPSSGGGGGSSSSSTTTTIIMHGGRGRRGRASVRSPRHAHMYSLFKSACTLCRQTVLDSFQNYFIDKAHAVVEDYKSKTKRKLSRVAIGIVCVCSCSLSVLIIAHFTTNSVCS